MAIHLRMLFTSVSLVLLIGCTQPETTPVEQTDAPPQEASPAITQELPIAVEAPPFHRFVEDMNNEDQWSELKWTLGVETRNVIFAPAIGTMRIVRVGEDGQIKLRDLSAFAFNTPRGMPIAMGYKMPWMPASLPTVNASFEEPATDNPAQGWRTSGSFEPTSARNAEAGESALALLAEGSSAEQPARKENGDIRGQILTARIHGVSSSKQQLSLELRYRVAGKDQEAVRQVFHSGSGNWEELYLTEPMPHTLVPGSTRIVLQRLAAPGSVEGDDDLVAIDQLFLNVTRPFEIEDWQDIPPKHVVLKSLGVTLGEAGDQLVQLAPQLSPGQGIHAQYLEVVPAQLALETKPRHIPPGSRLTFGFGLHQPPPEHNVYPVRFTLQATSEAGNLTLFETVVDPESTNPLGSWTDAEVDLAPLEGANATFKFITEILAESREISQRSPYLIPLWSTPTLCTPASTQRPKGPNVLLISIDTLAARHMSLYGYERDTTPRLDAWADELFVFDNAIAPATWTLPAHASVLTGLSAAAHGAGVNRTGYQLQRGLTTLAEALRKNGYLTSAFTEGVAVRGSLGFDQGFDTYSNGTNRPLPQGLVTETFRQAEEWIDRYQDEPYFMFVHTYETHWPYQPPAAFANRYTSEGYRQTPTPFDEENLTQKDKQRFVDHYDAEIAYVDSLVDGFLNRLKEKGALKNTVVILFSDHGEEFWEHDAYGHLNNHQIYDEVLHVPLIIRLPGDAPAAGRIERVVNTSDIFSTVLDLTGVAWDAPLDSQSLMPLINPARGGEYDREFVMSQLVIQDKPLTHSAGELIDWTMQSLHTQTEKYIRSNKESVLGLDPTAQDSYEAAAATHREELYNLKLDADERQNLADDNPERAEYFRAHLNAFLEALGTETASDDEPFEMDDALRRQFEAMGYL